MRIVGQTCSKTNKEGQPATVCKMLADCVDWRTAMEACCSVLAVLPCLPAATLGSSLGLSSGHSNGNGHVSLGDGRASAPVPGNGHTSAGSYTTIRTPTSDSSSSSESVSGPVDIDFDKWQSTGIPLPLIAACAACQNGVKRAHLVDAQMDGSLLLELYSRDGVGVMLSADFYEVGTAACCLQEEC